MTPKELHNLDDDIFKLGGYDEYDKHWKMMFYRYSIKGMSTDEIVKSPYIKEIVRDMLRFKLELL